MARNQQFNWNTGGFDIRPEAMEMSRQMSVAILEHCQTLWTLHLDALDGLTEESTRQIRQALRNAANRDHRPNQWPEQFYLRRRKFVELARGWLDMSSHATAEINQLWGQALTASLKVGEPKSATYPHRERRIGAMVIQFADRRRSSHQSKAGAGPTPGSIGAARAERHSAG